MHSAPLATISLAANILQFIDWVSEAIQVAEDVRDKGTGSAFAISVYDASEVLRYQISRLVVNDRISCDTKSDYTARKIATECSKLAQKLLNFAETLQVKEEDSSFSEQECLMTGMPKKWEKFQRKYLSAKKTLNKEGTTFAKALRFMWNKKTISLLIEQIDNYRKLMCSEVLMGIRESVAETIETMHRISHDQVAGHHQSAIAQKESENTLLDAIESHSDELCQQLAALEQSSRDREMKILSAIQTFVKTVEKGGSYPVLPVAVMGYDPSISSNAHNKGRLIESSVLSQLQFRRMHAREAEVKDAYAKTCSWIFEQTEFSEWLEEGQGIYWISGKAGCGKSTLMKLVVGDPRTLIALRRWCAQSSLHVESYFFWFGGSELQKNQEGLLRSLLHGILSRVSELIPRAFPEMYNAMMARLLITNETPETFFQCDQPGLSSSTLQDSTYSDQLNEGCGILTLTELKSALLFVVSELPKDLKLCLFIDGLDEYSGNHRDIIDLFRLLVARSYNVKAVVSSRPEPIFIESFTSYPQNRMEELTSQDIDHYVRSHLLQHRRMVSLRLWNQDGVETLFMSVVKRSCGVFLWVFLVTRALLDGLNDGSSLSELHQISEDYPDELQKVYEHMLDRMTPRHRLHGLQLLLCISIAQDTEDSLPSLLRLSFINQAPELALTAKLLQKSPDDLQDTLESMENRLRNRCCGLIEVGSFKACGEIKFLHRTVAEFLRTMATMMRDETEKSGFRPYVALISSTIMSFKAWEFFTISPEVSFVEVYGPTLQGFFHHCGHMLEGAGQSTGPGAYIYELDKILTHFWNHRCLENMPGKTARSHWVDGIAVSTDWLGYYNVTGS
ncbi:unnamed protein product [Clonostachys solani]|uniref:NACHT domain-containing protein n=1 Tax=Clonostachys solani TaxID=160281 RepID=A0A9N9ZB60_9HYPO|nr:unnamed protein product [Clonostachys solani]